MNPMTQAYVTRAATTATAIISKTDMIGEIALTFFRSCLKFIFFSSFLFFILRLNDLRQLFREASLKTPVEFNYIIKLYRKTTYVNGGNAETRQY
jgi:hypothetical protein